MVGLTRASRRRRFALAAAAAAALSLATALWASPQVLLLLKEGYPPLTFDEGGRHATVARFGDGIQLLHSTLYEAVK
jgi:hypothetical protein